MAQIAVNSFVPETPNYYLQNGFYIQAIDSIKLVLFYYISSPRSKSDSWEFVFNNQILLRYRVWWWRWGYSGILGYGTRGMLPASSLRSVTAVVFFPITLCGIPILDAKPNWLHRGVEELDYLQRCAIGNSSERCSSVFRQRGIHLLLHEVL